MKREKKAGLICGLLFAMIGLLGCGEKGQKELVLTNVSYDPTRELYERYVRSKN